MTPLIGKSLSDRYRILSLMGSGGMGDVYLAEHVVLGRKMAVKVLKEEMCRNEELVKRFQQEAIAASRIGQENIVSVTDFGRTDDGALYFVMEALGGTSLSTLVQRDGPFAPERALAILLQVSRALGAAHSQGIVHRDLKAENVMVIPRDDGSELVKVLDFGISKMSSLEDAPAESRLTQAGMVMGTPDYMSPEQARGDRIDQRADIYSFGVLAYELVTGTVPFTAATLTGVLMKHITEMPEPPSRRVPDLAVPPSLEAMILRALEKDPARRQQSMVEIRDALTEVAEEIGAPVLTPARGLRLAAEPRSSGRLMPAPRSTPPQAASEDLGRTFVRPSSEVPIPASDAVPTSRVPAPRRGKGMAMGLAAGVLLLGAGGGVVGLRAGAIPAAWLPPALARRAPPASVPTAPAPVPPAVPTPIAATAPAAAHPGPDTAPSTGKPGAAPTSPGAVAASSPGTSVAPKPPPVPATPQAQEDPEPAQRLAARPIAAKLTGAMVIPVLKSSQHRMQACLISLAGTLPAKSGQLDLAFKVGGSGELKSLSILNPGLAGSPMEKCLFKAVRKSRFPRTRAPENSFRLPIDYGTGQ